MTESREQRIRRLIYRSSYTAMRETDKLLGAFARANLHRMDDGELDAYEALLDAGDPEIWGWVSGRKPLPDSGGIADNPALMRLVAWVKENSL